MQGSIERVKAVIRGEMPDRAPLFDLLRNDAVIEHFTGSKLTVENAPDLVPVAFESALDATRSLIVDRSRRRSRPPKGEVMDKDACLNHQYYGVYCRYAAKR